MRSTDGAIARCIPILAIAAAACSAPALADAPPGSDPSANFSAGAMPRACAQQPYGAACVNAAVYYLDQARKSVGQPAYKLPADFVSLTPERQAFVLSNLDRLQYGLPPIGGLTDALGADAAKGVQADGDPSASDPNIQESTSNWAGAFETMALAYEAWMYDDGPGSGNLDCTASNTSGCWGHRHDVLWGFHGTGPIAMGAATGTDPQGQVGYAMLLAQGNSSYHPVFTYTWDQAVADGAGSNAYDPGTPQVPVPVHVTVSGPGSVVDQSGARCSGSCTFQETQDVPVTFTARPNAGATFTGWGGACSGKTTCTVKPEGSATALTAAFSTAPTAPCRLRIGALTFSHGRVGFPVTACKAATVRIRVSRRGRVVARINGRVRKGKGRVSFSAGSLPRGRYTVTVQIGSVTRRGTFVRN